MISSYVWNEIPDLSERSFKTHTKNIHTTLEKTLMSSPGEKFQCQYQLFSNNIIINH